MKKFYCANRTVTTENPAFVMGIVNCTPDSFYAESRGGLDSALRLIDEGADILDIGGESTRPGSRYVDEDEEIRRVVPLISAIRARGVSLPISVDTRKGAVMKAAFEAGADILNDVSALEDDERLLPFCVETKIPVVLMHKRGLPETMQADPLSGDIFAAVSNYLLERARLAEAAGIEAKKIIVDPGIGFGKDCSANLALIRKCGALCGGRYQVLMALSRKTVIGQLLAEKSATAFSQSPSPLTPLPPEERLYGTLAANMLSVLAGASIIRVHDVKAAVHTMTVLGKVGYTVANECLQ